MCYFSCYNCKNAVINSGHKNEKNKYTIINVLQVVSDINQILNKNHLKITKINEKQNIAK